MKDKPLGIAIGSLSGYSTNNFFDIFGITIEEFEQGLNSKSKDNFNN